MSNGFVRRNSADQEKKLDADVLLVDGVEVHQLRTSRAPLTVLVDEDNPAIIYVGEAQPGALPSTPVWRIKQILTAGSKRYIRYVNGDSGYSYIWDNRSSYTYL